MSFISKRIINSLIKNKANKHWDGGTNKKATQIQLIAKYAYRE